MLLRCALAAAYDACRRREAALAEALRAVEAESTNAAALTTLGLLELPRQRTSALVTLKSATLCAARQRRRRAPGAPRGRRRSSEPARAPRR